MESFRRYNMHYIDENTLVVAAGNTVKIFNTVDSSYTLLPGVAGSSIGAIAV